MHDFTRLRVWAKANELAMAVHHVTHRSDFSSAPGLSAQLLRASASIAANIAEGAGQESPAQFARFLTISIGSASEVENHLLHAHGVRILGREEAEACLAKVREVRRMLFGLRNYVRAKR